MAWDFSTDPQFEKQLAWMRDFVRDEIMPLETLDVDYRVIDQLTAPLKKIVKKRGLWAAHLPPELGGGGFGQVKLALMAEILGQTRYAAGVFGNQAPDSGNAELLALGANDAQKEKWMYPLLRGDLRSAFSMTEPGAGADPTMLSTRAVRVGDQYVINGHKWFSSNASIADFVIAMVVTDPEAPPHERASMIVVPTNTPGFRIVRDVPVMAKTTSGGVEHGHTEVIYEDVRVPVENLIGRPGQGFRLAQKRLGPGRIHHAMRWLGQSKRAFDMLCERAVSRTAFGSTLAEKQMVQDWVALSAAEMHAARLMTLHAAWRIDQGDAVAARTEISMIKYWGAKVLHDVIDRSLQVHGSLGFTTDMPLEGMYRAARAARILDGPDEVHKVSVARSILSRFKPVSVPTEHVPTRREAAIRKFAAHLEAAEANL